MERDAWFFVAVFVFIFLIWIATGGPLHPISFAGPTLKPPEELGGGTYLQFPRSPFSIGGSNVRLPGSSNGQPFTYNSYNPYSYTAPSSNTIPQIIEGVVFGTPSPYSNQVSLSNYVSSASSTDEYVEIRVASNSSNSVNITGWTLKSEATYKAEIIPKGTAVPTSGIVNATQDIVLNPGDSAIISTGPSPVGASFRENKCTGYFSSFQHFSPSLSQSCPSASDELSTLYGTPYIHDPVCIDYTSTLSRCQVPTREPSNITITCEDFLVSHLNYNGCVKYHGGDSDFNGTVWHVYLNRVYTKGPLTGTTKPMWRTNHEVVKLLDDRQKTVAAFTY